MLKAVLFEVHGLGRAKLVEFNWTPQMSCSAPLKLSSAAAIAADRRCRPPIPPSLSCPVQGVFFRAHTEARARQMGLVGYVLNTPLVCRCHRCRCHRCRSAAVAAARSRMLSSLPYRDDVLDLACPHQLPAPLAGHGAGRNPGGCRCSR